MLKTIVPVKTICSTFSPWKNEMRSFFNMRKIKRAFRRYVYQSESKPPYFHITQVGDPVLRAPTLPVNFDVIQMFPFQMVSISFYYLINIIINNNVNLILFFQCLYSYLYRCIVYKKFVNN